MKNGLIPGIFLVLSLLQGNPGHAMKCSPLIPSSASPARQLTDTVYRMDFETIPDFSLTFGDWTTADIDHQATYGIENHTFPHQLEPMAFLCFNPAQVVPSMASEPNIQPHGGQRFGACFSSNPPSNNDWFISPHVQLGLNGSFSFWIKSFSDLYGLDKYQVLVSVTDNNPASFIPISDPDTLTTTLTWTRHSYNLANYNNQAVYLAIRCVSNDNWLIMIDDLEIHPQSSDTLTAGFMADKTTARVGEAINFTDQSIGFPATWEWSFPGGTPATSVMSNPDNIKYSMPGVYSVTLRVGNGVTYDTLTRENYITITGYPSNVTQDFEAVESFSLVFEPWTTIDVGGGNTYGINGVSFPHQFAPMAYINFVPSATSPALTNMLPHSGTKSGCCFSSEPPSNPNNKWLISPKMTLGAAPQIELWVQTYNSEYGDEKFNIAVSTTDLNPSNFTLLTSTPETAPIAWTRRTFSLAAYTNQTVYVAIQCVTDNGFIFMVDDIAITSAVGLPETPDTRLFSVYPNPARHHFTIDPGKVNMEPYTLELISPGGKTLRIWNSPGEKDNNLYDISGISPGIYLLRFTQLSGTTIKKLTILP